ncbi:hypothetical protein HOY80DRAFT_1043209 [Tuber brumale]|nr:hypothetical protein HOY80DRAFT_1043209 [Tuber brumale]
MLLNTRTPNSRQVTPKNEEVARDGIKQICMHCNSEEDKFRVMIEIYHVLTTGPSILLVKMKPMINIFSRRMEPDWHKVVTLHEATGGVDRDKSMSVFRSGKAKVFVTTNAFVRGKASATVKMVVNFDLRHDKRDRPDPEPTFTSMYYIDQISNYRGICKTRVPTNDLDEVEKAFEKVLKSERARTTKEGRSMFLQGFRHSKPATAGRNQNEVIAGRDKLATLTGTWQEVYRDPVIDACCSGNAELDVATNPLSQGINLKVNLISNDSAVCIAPVPSKNLGEVEIIVDTPMKSKTTHAAHRT